MSEENIQAAENIIEVQKTLNLWLMARIAIPVLAGLLCMACVMAHGKFASIFPNQSILCVVLCIAVVLTGAVFANRLCQKKSGILFKTAAVIPVLSEKYQTKKYHHSGDFSEHLRHAIIEGNLWQKASVNDYFEGINEAGYVFECFDVRLKFNAIVLQGNVFKGHIVIIDMPWRITGDPVDILHKTMKTEGHRQIRNLPAFKDAGFALRFEVSYTDEDIIERLNQQSEGVKLKLAMTQNDKQVVKLAEDVDINKPIVALESLIHEKFAHQLIDIENETNELVSIHIQNDKMYLSMASFHDIFEPRVWDLWMSPEKVKDRVRKELKYVDAMIQLMNDKKPAE